MRTHELVTELEQMAERLRDIRVEDPEGWVPRVSKILADIERQVRGAVIDLELS
jgi:hypothetical protein